MSRAGEDLRGRSVSFKEEFKRAGLLGRTLACLEEENLILNEQLSFVGTDEYIGQSAIQNYGFVSKNDIRFTISNPDALDAYTAEEWNIAMEERAN